ncbi:MAG: hypothetical protein ACE144_01630 [Thermodesulfobacteriota bacterium]
MKSKPYVAKKSRDRLPTETEEQIVQRFPYLCPYCDQPISYEGMNLRVGENEIECPSCRKIYIKIVSDD